MKLLFYGNLAEVIGREIDLPVQSGATVGDIRRHLAKHFPQVAPLLGSSVRGCIGDEIVADAAIVPEGAELAFLPPLSGG